MGHSGGSAPVFSALLACSTAISLIVAAVTNALDVPLGRTIPLIGALGCSLLVGQLVAAWPLGRTHPTITLGAARVFYLVWNGYAWPALLGWAGRPFGSPLLHSLVAAGTAPVPLRVHVAVQTLGCAACWWVGQAWRLLYPVVPAPPAASPVHLAAAALLTSGAVLIWELTCGKTPNKPCRRAWRHGCWRCAACQPLHGAAARGALALQPMPFALAFLEKSYVAAAAAAPGVAPFAYDCLLYAAAASALLAAGAGASLALGAGGAAVLWAAAAPASYTPARPAATATAQVAAAVAAVSYAGAGAAVAQALALAAAALGVHGGVRVRAAGAAGAAAGAAAAAARAPWPLLGAAGSCVAAAAAALLVPLALLYTSEAAARRRFLARLIASPPTSRSPPTAAADADDSRAALGRLRRSLVELGSGGAARLDAAALDALRAELEAFAANCVGGAEVLVCLGARDAAVAALLSGDVRTQLDGLRLLLSLCKESNEVMEVLLRHGGAKALVAAAACPSTPSGGATSALYALSVLANDDTAALLLTQADAVHVCAALLTSPTLAQPACRALMVLLSTMQPPVTAAAQAAGAIPTLAALASAPVPHLRDDACSALAFVALSGSARARGAVYAAGGVRAFVSRLAAGGCDPMAATAATGIASLARGCPAVRAEATRAGAVPALVRLMARGPEDARAFAMYAVEALLSGSDGARASAEFVGCQGMLPLVGLLQRSAGNSARLEAGSSLLGSLYQHSPGLRQQLLAASTWTPPALQLLINGSDADNVAAVRQVMLDANIYRGSRTARAPKDRYGAAHAA